MKTSILFSILGAIIIAFSSCKSEREKTLELLRKSPWKMEDMISDADADGTLESVINDCAKEIVYSFKFGRDFYVSNRADSCTTESFPTRNGIWDYIEKEDGDYIVINFPLTLVKFRLDEITDHQMILFDQDGYVSSFGYKDIDYIFSR